MPVIIFNKWNQFDLFYCKSMPTLARVSRVLLEFLEGRVSTHKKQKKLR